MSLRPYVASGRGGLGAIFAVLVAAVLAGTILGAIESLVSQWLSLFLIFPALIGVAAGATAAGVVSRYKLRAPAIALVVGFAGGAAGYVAEHAVTYARFRSEIATAIKSDLPGASDAEIASELDGRLIQEVGAPGFHGFLSLMAREGVQLKRTSGGSDAGISFKGTAAWILWGIELLIAAGIAGALPWSKAREPFCEDCGLWYGPAGTLASGGAGSKAMHKQLMSALELGDLDGAARAFFGARDAKSPAVFQLTAAMCSRCSGDAYCRLDRVVVAKRQQRGKLATWLVPRHELTQLTSALGRANPSAGQRAT
jgi:hypothetical protein